MYNKVILLGRLTKTPELKSTPTGVSVCTFSIAVDRRFQTKGEERKADFFNCVAWRGDAEFISRYFDKGNPILVEGELQNRSYADKDGITRYVTEVIVSRATFTGSKAANSEAAEQPATVAAVDTVETTATDDEYPFF